MTNENIRVHGSELNYNKNRVKKLLVPVTAPQDQPHPIKYLILNEEPKEYMCEKGCIHKYPFSLNKKAIEVVSEEAPLNNRDSILTKNNAKLKRVLSPVSFKYTPPGKPIVALLDKNSLESSVTPCSTDISRNALRSLKETPSLSSRVRSLSTPNSSKSCSKLRTPSPPPKSYNEHIIEQKPLYNSAGKKYTTSELFKRNVSRRFLNSSNEESTIEITEKEYDKNCDVFNRLYPFVQTVKQIPESMTLKMDWDSYHRLKVIYDFMAELESLFPSLCTVGVIGQSLEGRDIKLLKISNGNANNSAVWIDSGIHAREWIGPAVGTYIANHIARNFDKLPVCCSNKDWYFLPVANPDGYEYSHTKYRMWRKNRAWAGGKCVGVDLNRNFSVAWGGKGSSGDPNNNFYRGTHPFSEPESNALKGVLQDSQLPFKVYITLHAFGEVIIFPLAHSDDLCPDYVRLLRGATVMARAIYNTNGTTYRVGVSKDVMYRASGTSNDWCYSAVGIPYCYLVELRSKKHKLPEPQITDTGMEILNCVKALMEFVDNYPIEQNSGDHDHKQSIKTKKDSNQNRVNAKT